MKYILDTNVISDLYSGKGENYLKICEKMETLEDDNLYISILTLYELEYGYENTSNKGIKKIIRDKIDNIVNDFYLLSLSQKASSYFGQLKKSLVNSRNLNKESSKKHNIDIMIASTAIVESCILVSNDKIYVTTYQVKKYI